MKQPFTVYECKVYRVDHCKAYQAQQARGMFGFHYYEKCPDCQVTFEGYEYWGENGHRQAAFDEPAGAEHASRMGWTVKTGGDQHYVGRML